MSLARSTALVALGTVLSRLLGFVRDLMIARLFGSGPVADALLMALRIPNLFRRVLGEGGLNAGFVPLYTRIKARDGDIAARKFAHSAVINMGILLSVLVAISHVLAPWLVYMQSAVETEGVAGRALAATYLTAALPFVIGATLASIFAAWLAAERHFVIAALVPISVNLVLVVGLAVFENMQASQSLFSLEKAGFLFAGLWSIAGFFQLIITVAFAKNLSLEIRLFRVSFNKSQRRLMAIGLPVLAASGAPQMMIMVAAIAASYVPSWVSWLYYADRLFALPLGFIAAATGIILLPEISKDVAEHEAGSEQNLLNRALESSCALALPAAVAMMVLATPIVTILFQRGAFTHSDAVGTAAILAGFAPGLCAAACSRTLVQAFFAREQLKGPLMATLIGCIVTALGVMISVKFGGVAGVGWGITLGLTVNMLWLVGLLLLRNMWRPDRQLLQRCVRLIFSGAAMGCFLLIAADWMAPVLNGHGGRLFQWLALGAICTGGLVLYVILAIASGGISRKNPFRSEKVPG